MYDQSQLLVQKSAENISQNVNSYKRKAFEMNNPYADILRPAITPKPKTRKERYLEEIRNKPRPRFGDGLDGKNCVNIPRKSKTNTKSFYSSDADKPSFAKLGIHEELCYKAAEKNASKPTDVQCTAIPMVFSENNNLFVAPTGSGLPICFIFQELNFNIFQTTFRASCF